ncbi:MAG: hypothetical protein IPJ07_11015 [Acidobacteria bacterium]|nr:hypothetical protein [Acidobacteriota bacterium]
MITFEQTIVQNIDTIQIQLMQGDGALDLNSPGRISISRDGDIIISASHRWMAPWHGHPRSGSDWAGQKIHPAGKMIR